MVSRLLSGFLVLILFQINLYAQTSQNPEHKSFWKSLWVSIETNQGWVLADYGKFGNYKTSKPFDMRMIGAQVKAGYYITPRLSLGAGIGLRNYSTANNTFPVFVDLRYHLLPSLPKLYAFADIGASLEGADNAFTRGFISDIGAGYKIRLGKRISFNPSIGYNIISYPLNMYGYDEQTRQTVSLGKVNRTSHTLFIQLGFQF